MASAAGSPHACRCSQARLGRLVEGDDLPHRSSLAQAIESLVDLIEPQPVRE
jgi:hypothetical protein